MMEIFDVYAFKKMYANYHLPLDRKFFYERIASFSHGEDNFSFGGGKPFKVNRIGKIYGPALLYLATRYESRLVSSLLPKKIYPVESVVISKKWTI